MGIVPTDGTGAAPSDERESRYFLVSTAALGQATTYLPIYVMCGAETESTMAGREIRLISVVEERQGHGSSRFRQHDVSGELGRHVLADPIAELRQVESGEHVLAPAKKHRSHCEMQFVDQPCRQVLPDRRHA